MLPLASQFLASHLNDFFSNVFMHKITKIIDLAR